MVKNPNRFRNIALPIVGIIVLSSIILIALTNIIAFAVLGGVAIAAYFLLSFIYWTCPNCKKFLPWNSGPIEFCPYCGCAFNVFDDEQHQ